MQYLIAGKTQTIYDYLNKLGHFYMDGSKAIISSKKIFDEIVSGDTIVLLPGWWAKEWAKEPLSRIINDEELGVHVRFADGQFGEEARNNLKSDNIDSRFDILDL